MKRLHITRSRPVQTEADRQKALAVLVATYQQEKGWVADAETVFPASDLAREDVSWFLATRGDHPVGVLRVLYDPPIDTYMKYGLEPIDPSLDVKKLIGENRIAEIGRFAVMPERRGGITVSVSLMRVSTRDVVSRGYTQLITDVFENEKNSPLGFHMRIIGFKPVATHAHGELRHKGRRITLLLDIRSAYQALKKRGNWFFRALTKGWPEAVHQRLAV
jgi:hypothetical protein